MKTTVAFVLLLVLFAGCRNTRPTPDSAVQVPVRISAFPSFDEQSRLREITIDVVMLVEPDGSVSDAMLVSAGGSDAWNAAALDSVKNWRFSALRDSHRASPTWYRRSIRVLFQNPVFLRLTELEMTSKTVADSVYQVLRETSDFDAFTHDNRQNTDINVQLEALTDISRFPEFLRFELQGLRPERFTQPIYLGGKFYIYRRAADPETPT